MICETASTAAARDLVRDMTNAVTAGGERVLSLAHGGEASLERMNS